MTAAAPRRAAPDDPADAFAEAMSAHGLFPARIVADGRLHRFPTGARRHDDAGWYVLHSDDVPCGAFGDWRTGSKATWSARRREEMSPIERMNLRAVRREQAQLLAEDRAARHAEAQTAAEAALATARPSDADHPYLAAKAVGAYGIAQDATGRLLVPVRDLDGTLHGLQTIGPDGTKLFLTGTAKRGHCHLIGTIGDTVVIAEGYATGATIHAATGLPVAVAFDRGNLSPVAAALRRRWPEVRIVVAADDDSGTDGNPGLTDGKAAAAAVGGALAVPVFAPGAAVDGKRPTDFNDLARIDGLGPVRRAISTALAKEPETETTDQTITRLARLDPLAYDRVREAEAKRLGVRVGTLDRTVNDARQQYSAGSGGGGESSGTSFADPEPWSDPVDGAAVLDELAAALRRYLVLPAGAPETVALWIMHAHLHDTSAISPILAVTSPVPECGKTSLLDLLQALTPRPMPTANITAAALFRSVEKWRPTVLIDEADTFLRQSDELRGIINSGQRRSNAYVVRTVGDEHEPRQFRTWAPKVIALIGKLPDTLASRSLHVELRRKTAVEHVEQLRLDRLEHLEPVRRRCARFALDAADAVRGADPVLPNGLHNRAADNWRHLVAIADVAGGDWPARARAVAEVAGSRRSEQSAGIMLLEDLRMLFAQFGVGRVATRDLVAKLGEMMDRPWPEWRDGKPITERQLAKLLGPFDVKSKKLRLPDGRAGHMGYIVDDFADAFGRYLDPPSSTAPQTPETTDLGRSDAPRAANSVEDDPAPKRRRAAGCGAVEGTRPGMWEDEL